MGECNICDFQARIEEGKRRQKALLRVSLPLNKGEYPDWDAINKERIRKQVYYHASVGKRKMIDAVKNNKTLIRWLW